MPTVDEVILEYAKKNGYTGLYCPDSDGECGCSLDDDDRRECMVLDCRFGYVTECINCDHKDNCPLRKQEDCDMCITP